MEFQITYSCVSHIGLRRKMNQDNFFCDGVFFDLEKGACPQFPLAGKVSSNQNTLFGVFDGMGGEARGEMASYLAARRAFYTVRDKPAADVLNEICLSANQDICVFTQEHHLSACGTTAAMLLLDSTGVTLCNIGDSKVFRFSAGTLHQISQDHLSIAPFGSKAPLLQYLGIPPDEMYICPYFSSLEYCAGDCYVICSDGLTDMVPNDVIMQISTSSHTENTAQKLLETALSNGGKDNITIIVLQIRKKENKFQEFIKRFI